MAEEKIREGMRSAEEKQAEGKTPDSQEWEDVSTPKQPDEKNS